MKIAIEMAMSEANTAKLEDFQKGIKQRAERMIHEVMPTKVVELTKVIDEHPFFKTNQSDILPSFEWADNDEDGGSRKKRKLNGDSNEAADGAKRTTLVPCNKALKDFHQGVLKPEVHKSIECANAVKVWIQLNVPRIEDGDNFGVEVQQEALEEFTRAENSGLAILESLLKYHCNRAKLTSKVLKYPNVDDYKQSVMELDMKEHISTKLCLMDIRNCYATLHDVVMKNYEKLNQPRRASRAQYY